MSEKKDISHVVFLPIRAWKEPCRSVILKTYLWILSFSNLTEELDLKFFGKIIPRPLLKWRLMQMKQRGLVTVTRSGQSYFVTPVWTDKERIAIDKIKVILKEAGLVGVYDSTKDKLDLTFTNKFRGNKKANDMTTLAPDSEVVVPVAPAEQVEINKIETAEAKAILLPPVQAKPPIDMTPRPKPLSTCPICHGAGYFMNRDDEGSFKEICQCSR